MHIQKKMSNFTPNWNNVTNTINSDMTNTEFWESISIIINSGFDNDGIIKLDEYAEQFFNKQLLFKRYTPSEQHGCAAGGGFHVIASLLAGAETPANQLTASEGSFERECQRAEAQADVIEQWALNSSILAIGLMRHRVYI